MRKIFWFTFFTIGYLQVLVLGKAGAGGSSSGYSSGGGYTSSASQYGYGRNSSADGSIPDWLAFVIICSILVMLFRLLFRSSLRTSYYNRKSNAALRVLRKAAERDGFWNEKMILDFTKEAFVATQRVWSTNNLSRSKHILTEKFITKYQPKLNRYQAAKRYNYTDKVQINSVDVLSVLDFNDDSLDSCVVKVRGKMIDKVVRLGGKPKNQELVDFEDLVYLVRNGDLWLIDDIQSTSHKYEEDFIPKSKLGVD